MTLYIVYPEKAGIKKIGKFEKISIGPLKLEADGKIIAEKVHGIWRDNTNNLRKFDTFYMED